MPDPTGRWASVKEWQCPVCGAINGRGAERCQQCDRSVRPSAAEPIRPLDPLDVIGKRRDGDDAEHVDPLPAADS